MEEGARALPAVVAVGDGRHWGGVPLAFALFTPFEACADDVVSVLVDIGFDAEFLADDAFDGESSAVDGRADVLDDDGVRVPIHGKQGG